MKLHTVMGDNEPDHEVYIVPLCCTIPATGLGYRRVEMLRFANSVNSLAFSFRSARRCCEGEVCRVTSRGGPPEG